MCCSLLRSSLLIFRKLMTFDACWTIPCRPRPCRLLPFDQFLVRSGQIHSDSINSWSDPVRFGNLQDRPNTNPNHVHVPWIYQSTVSHSPSHSLALFHPFRHRCVYSKLGYLLHSQELSYEYLYALLLGGRLTTCISFTCRQNIVWA